MQSKEDLRKRKGTLMCATQFLSARGLRVPLVALASIVALGIRDHGASQNDRVTIDIDDPRPLAGAVRALEDRYGWVITYEDPPYVHPSEISDVTQAVRKDYAPDKPKVQIPRARPFTFSYPIPAGPSAPDEASTLEALLEAHHTSGNPGVFRVVRSGAVFHVVPAASTGLAGGLEKRRSILDTNISVADEERNGLGMIEAIRDAIQRSTGVRVLIGIVPMNLLSRVRIQGGAENEKARTVLLRTLAGTDWKLSWQLFREGGPAGRYGLNIHAVRDGTSHAR